MQVMFIEGKDGEALRALARGWPYPYRLLYRAEQGLYLLEVWAYAPGIEAQAAALPGVRYWSFALLEEGWVSQSSRFGEESFYEEKS
nr:hypothetical protein [Meiothermus rufus]